MSFGGLSLRARLTWTAVAGAAVTLAILVVAFNLILDSRLRGDADNVLRERATTVLRALGTVDGRLSVIEAPDQGAIDAQTWIFAEQRTLERPAGADPRNELAVRKLARAGSGFTSVEATDTRLHAVTVRSGGRQLGTVIVGASLAPYESTASAALLGSAILGLLVLAATAALSRWLIGRALQPVARIAARAADWEAGDLSRRFYAGDPHDELTSLASVLDDLLGRLAQSLRHEQRLTAEISHELRTPLAKILAEAELATGRARSPDEQRAALRSIQRHAEGLQRVLEALLAAARADPQDSPAGGDACLSAERASASMRETLASDGKRLELVCDRGATVAVEPEVLERILSPVLDNAARYARRQVTLTVREVGGQAIFEVRDDGPGIQNAHLQRVFDPGFRAEETSTAPHAGAGLGLPLVRRLARAAGGEVEAVPSPEGAKVVVRLPGASTARR
jgi:signal transduction histidine kinase